MGMSSNKITMPGTWPGARPKPEVFSVPFPLLPPVGSPQYPTTPLPRYSNPNEIPCNLCRRFPLYGVEAGGLPVKAAQRKQSNMDEDLKLYL